MLPSGTVTFLFTDIEGSTQLWETRPEFQSLWSEGRAMSMERAIELALNHTLR